MAAIPSAIGRNTGGMRWIFSANVSPLGTPEAVARDHRRGGISGGSLSRPALPRALRGARRGGKAFRGLDSLRKRRGGFDFPARAGQTAEACAGSRADVRGIRGGAGNGRLRRSPLRAGRGERFCDDRGCFWARFSRRWRSCSSASRITRRAGGGQDADAADFGEMRGGRRAAGGGRVLLDFLPDGEALTMKPELAAHGSLFILKAFTKLYGMAGVRLGYGLCADAALLERMRRAGQPWAVSSLAQAAGLAALTQRDYVRQVRALIETERPYLLAGASGAGAARDRGRPITCSFARMRRWASGWRRGALIRRCGNYPGLDDTWYRTAVRTRREKTTRFGRAAGGAGMSRAKRIMVQGR